MLVQIAWSGAIIAEVSCPTRYFPEASSIISAAAPSTASAVSMPVSATGWPAGTCCPGKNFLPSGAVS